MKKVNFFVFIFALVIFSCTNNQEKEKQQNIHDSIDVIKESPEVIKARERTKDSLALIAKAKVQYAEIMSAIEYLTNTVPKKYHGEVDEMASTAREFTHYARIYNVYIESDVDSISNAAKKLKTTLQKTQKQIFPILRKSYTNFAKRKLWEEDITVNSNNKTITFTGGIFAANKNMQSFHDGIYDMLYLLRFSKANYKWYKNASEYTIY